MKPSLTILGMLVLSANAALGNTPAARQIPHYFERIAPSEFTAPRLHLYPGGFALAGLPVDFDGATAAPSPGSAFPARITRIHTAAAAPVDAFETVRYRRLYPGVDAIFHYTRGILEFDFDIAPGADITRIRLCAPAARLHQGDLVLGDARIHRPEVFQDGSRILARLPVASPTVPSASNSPPTTLPAPC